jgi:hypothetical protein
MFSQKEISEIRKMSEGFKRIQKQNQMGRYQKKYEDLAYDVKNKIKAMVEKKGKESEHSNIKVLKLKDEQKFNVGDRGSYIIEIGEEVLIDINGGQYHFQVLTLEQLCEIADNI